MAAARAENPDTNVSATPTADDPGRLFRRQMVGDETHLIELFAIDQNEAQQLYETFHNHWAEWCIQLEDGAVSPDFVKEMEARRVNSPSYRNRFSNRGGGGVSDAASDTSSYADEEEAEIGSGTYILH
eukprot:COSAG05_NODE_2415_length_3092_cov_13.057802_5_plen_128_part_00